MKILFTLIVVLVLAVVVYFFVLGFVSKSGAPAGLVSGKLSACPNKPNCVSSEAGEDETHTVTPLSIPKLNPADLLPRIKALLNKSGAEIVTAENNYIAATYTSAIFRFIDDLEIRIDENEKMIHFRSASRVGHSDLGVNRKRVESLKTMLSKDLNQ